METSEQFLTNQTKKLDISCLVSAKTPSVDCRLLGGRKEAKHFLEKFDIYLLP